MVHHHCFQFLLSSLRRCLDALFNWFFNCSVLQGDNQYRVSGQALEFKQLNIHAWEAFEKGQDIHMQAAPSQAELLFKNYKVIKEKLKSETKETIMEKYGNAAAKEELPMELLLGQSERQIEYDRAGRIIKGQVRSNIWLIKDNHRGLLIEIAEQCMTTKITYVMQNSNLNQLKKYVCMKEE